jgi:Zn-dependent protease
VTGTTPEPPQEAQQPDSGPQPRTRGDGRFGIVIARPFGVPVYISPYWFLVAALIVVFYGESLQGAVSSTVLRYVVAAAFVILLYASVLVHELSHCVVARSFGLTVRRILLWPMGGYSEIEQEPQTPVRELAVSAVGPLTSLALAGCGLGLLYALSPVGTARILVEQLILANGLVGVFNLLPGLPLDGGRMLRAGIWKVTGRPAQATITAAWGGRVLAVLLAIGALALFSSKLNDAYSYGIWASIIALYLWFSAGQSMRTAKIRARLPGLQARRLARRAIAIPGNVPLAEAIRRADEEQARALVIVDQDATPIALVNETAVMSTPQQRRPWVEVGSLARALEPGIVLSADLAGMELLEAVQRCRASEYLLIEPSGQVFGVLATTDLDHAFAGI